MMNSLSYGIRLMGGLFLLFCLGCSGIKKGGDPYAKTWESVISSQDWKHALKLNPDSTAAGNEAYFALPNWTDGSAAAADPEFVEAYPKLVSRAYFRLIAEALRADRRIRMSYQELSYQMYNADGSPSQRLKKDFETARKRYVAHRQMLDGLLAWRAFNTFGSDDLEYFMRQQLAPSLALYQRGVRQDKILDFLMTELADLYHKPGEGIPDNSL